MLTDVRNDRLDVLVLDHDACLDLGKQVYVHLESADLVDALVAGEALLGAAAHADILSSNRHYLIFHSSGNP